MRRIGLVAALSPEHVVRRTYGRRWADLFGKSDTRGNAIVRPIMKRVGIEWKGWQSFRRGVASTLVQLGASDMIVMKILRHSRVTITRDQYVKVQDPQVLAAMEELSRAVENGPRSRAAGNESNPS